MAVYNFTFPAAAAGLGVSIKDASGSEVDTVTAGAASGVQGPVVVAATLDVGSYTAEAVLASEYRTYRAPGVLDVPATLTAVAGRVAGAVDPESATFAADLVAALVAAGLMEAAE